MPNVLFAAPFLLPATLRFVDGAAKLPGVRLSLASQDPLEKVPQSIRGCLAAHEQLSDGLNPVEILRAARRISHRVGRLQHLIGPLEQLQVPLAQVREELGLPGLKTEAALNFRDKARMKSLLRQAGVPCARHLLAGDEQEVRLFLKEVGFPVVVKPNSGAGAKNTFRLNSLQDFENVRRNLRLDRAPALFEEFVTGEEHSFDSVSIDGELVWHSISRYLPTPLEVVENPWIQWCVLLPRDISGAEFDPIRDAAAIALKALGADTALCHMEWFRRPSGGVAISEVGARPPGAQFTSLLSYAHDLDFYSAWPRLMVYGEFAPPARLYAVGAAYLRGQGEGRVRAVRGLDRAQRDCGELVVEAQIPRPGQMHDGGYEGDGFVIFRHPETGRVEQALRRTIELVQIELG